MVVPTKHVQSPWWISGVTHVAYVSNLFLLGVNFGAFGEFLGQVMSVQQFFRGLIKDLMVLRGRMYGFLKKTL